MNIPRSIYQFTNSPIYQLHDSNLWFIDPAALAVGAPARLGEAVLAEHEAALLAARGLDDDRVAGGLRGSNRVTQIVFHVAAIEAELARDRRRRARFGRQNPDEVAPESHGAMAVSRSQRAGGPRD